MLRWTLHLKGAPNSGDNNHAAVAVGDKVYFFGGSQKEHIEVHVFNTVSLCWTKLVPVRNGRKQRPVEVPSRSNGHTAVLIEDIVYIWGRFPDRNVLYAFNVSLHRWFKPSVSGTIPEARRGHSACGLGKVMYVFGGYTNDIHKLDTTTMGWSFIDTGDTRAAPASSWHSATIIGTKMFIFGGLGHQDNDIRVFDTETNCWLRTPSAHLLPEERYGHSAFSRNGELYIFGGIHQGGSINNLWKFNSETSWTKVEPKGKVPYQNCWMCCCMVGDRIILFDDDLYILDLSSSLKTLCELAVIQHGLKKSELPPGTVGTGSITTTNKRRKTMSELTASMFHWMMMIFKTKKEICN